jgi:ATP-dependent RNA helicase DeaD
MKFDEMGLSPDTLKSVQALGFETPTPIQEQAIPILLEGTRDFVGLASTGTGKTAAFGLPLLERVDPDQRVPQGIILCPTRELCLQITSDLKNYSKHRQSLQVVAVYGGSPIVTQIRDLKRGAQIIVATPGRLMDLIERRAVKLEQISAVVLDEADEMLNMGFKEELDKILSKMPEGRVTWLFSATMAKGVARIAQNYQTDPIEVSVILQGKLTFLHVGSTAVSDAGLKQIEHLASLKDLKVTRTAVSPEGVEQLQKKLPNTTIQRVHADDQ